MSGGFWGVDVFATTAVEFDRFLIGNVRESEREKRLGLAQDPWATTEVGFFVFLELRFVFVVDRKVMG